MARSRTDRPLPLRWLAGGVAVLVLVALLVAGGRRDVGADLAGLEPVDATGVAPGSGQLAPEGHRETDTDLDTWVAPDRTAGAWYAFPLPSGYQAVPPPAGTELLIRSAGAARTAIAVARLPQEGRLSVELARAAAVAGGRTPVGDPVQRVVGGVPAVAADALDELDEPARLVRQVLLDVGTDRLVISIAVDARESDTPDADATDADTTDADTTDADVELGLIEAVVLDNLRTAVLD